MKPCWTERGLVERGECRELRGFGDGAVTRVVGKGAGFFKVRQHAPLSRSCAGLRIALQSSSLYCDGDGA